MNYYFWNPITGVRFCDPAYCKPGDHDCEKCMCEFFKLVHRFTCDVCGASLSAEEMSAENDGLCNDCRREYVRCNGCDLPLAKDGDGIVIGNGIALCEFCAAETIAKYNLVDCVRTTRARSAWDRGVIQYAEDLLEVYYEQHTSDELPTEHDLLNGAEDWEMFSYGGNALIYDCDIAIRLCTPSELKRCKSGERNQNKRENWLDVQARALRQAARLIMRYAREFELERE